MLMQLAALAGALILALVAIALVYVLGMRTKSRLVLGPLIRLQRARHGRVMAVVLTALIGMVSVAVIFSPPSRACSSTWESRGCVPRRSKAHAK